MTKINRDNLTKFLTMITDARAAGADISNDCVAETMRPINTKVGTHVLNVVVNMQLKFLSPSSIPSKVMAKKNRDKVYFISRGSKSDVSFLPVGHSKRSKPLKFCGYVVCTIINVYTKFQNFNRIISGDMNKLNVEQIRFCYLWNLVTHF